MGRYCDPDRHRTQETVRPQADPQGVADVGVIEVVDPQGVGLGVGTAVCGTMTRITTS